MKTTFDHTRYKINKTSKKLNQRIFEERREQADWYEPVLLQIGNKKLSPLEAKDNTEMMFRAEMHNRSMALTEKIINDENVAVHFFMPRSQEDNAQVVSPIMKNDDKLDSLSRWVAGFVFYCVKNRNPPPTLQPGIFLCAYVIGRPMSYAAPLSLSS